jgi:hypothetical protein
MSRILPRYTDQTIHHDPLEIMLAQREAQEQAARTAIANGNAGQQADPANLRGIPCLAKGVGSTSPGTSPHGEAAAGHLDNHRLRRIITT